MISFNGLVASDTLSLSQKAQFKLLTWIYNYHTEHLILTYDCRRWREAPEYHCWSPQDRTLCNLQVLEGSYLVIVP